MMACWKRLFDFESRFCDPIFEVDEILKKKRDFIPAGKNLFQLSVTMAIRGEMHRVELIK